MSKATREEVVALFVASVLAILLMCLGLISAGCKPDPQPTPSPTPSPTPTLLLFLVGKP